MVKSLLEFDSKLSDKEYRELTKLSYSQLSSLAKLGNRYFRDLDVEPDEDSEALRIGSAVDILLTTPEEFNNRIYSKPIVIPTSGTNTAILSEAVLKELPNLSVYDRSDDNSINLVNYMVETLGLWESVKDPVKKRGKWDTELFWNYTEAKFHSAGKIILSPEDREIVHTIVDTLKNHKFTKDLFTISEGIEVLYQYSLEYELEELPFKSRFDIIRVNHNNKTIKLIDIKTGFPFKEDFSKNYFKFKYYIQEGLYYTALYNLMKKIPKYQEYNLEEFEFLYVSRLEPTLPIRYTGLGVDLCMKGFMSKTGVNYPGIIELINQYKYYNTVQNEYESEVFNNNGISVINTDYLI